MYIEPVSCIDALSFTKCLRNGPSLFDFSNDLVRSEKAMQIKDREDSSASEYRAPRAAFSLSDFSLLRNIGDGSYSTVVLAQLKGASAVGPQQQLHAIKIVNKHLVSSNKAASIKLEYIVSMD